MRRSPLPSSFDGWAFRSSEAQLLLGLSPRRLRAPDIQHPHRGARSIGLDFERLRDRCRALETLLPPDAVFSHVTALGLLGAPVPASAELHVSVPVPRTPPRRPGVRGHSLTSVSARILDDLPVVAAEAAWRQSASLLDRRELVAAGDSLVTGRRVAGVRRAGVTTIERLARTVDLDRGRPGNARARWALARVRSGVDSAAETEIRLLLAGAGLPEPLVDHPIVVAGGLVLHSDIAYPEARIDIEYEGDGHRADRATWYGDIERRELIEDAGWRMVRVAAPALRDAAPLVGRIRNLLSIRAFGSQAQAQATRTHESRGR
ncbi:hypothetical protein [Pseudolysinimonas kribbensis]|uniref:hypothetical protein n=1 Tax=Pseudolysinimonas kribbensis TaxID=433641 RepID=UPI0031E131E3